MGKQPLKNYLTHDELFYVPEIFDCASTKAAEINGFRMVMISSADFACSYTGIPDLQLLSVDDYANLITRITDMTDMHLFIDGDDGFGRPLQTYNACRRMARAGADAILITDQAGYGKAGLLPLDEAIYRFTAAREGMEGTDCLLIARCDQSLDTDFPQLIERCQAYLEAGADIICPIGVAHATSFESKAAAAMQVAAQLDTVFWYPDLDTSDTPDDLARLATAGYRFTGIHFSFQAAMLAMLDTGRHVFESRTNDYIAQAYEHTGFRFERSTLSAFLRDGEWVDRESRYVSDRNDAVAVRKMQFTSPNDKFGPDKP